MEIDIEAFEYSIRMVESGPIWKAGFGESGPSRVDLASIAPVRTL